MSRRRDKAALADRGQRSGETPSLSSRIHIPKPRSYLDKYIGETTDVAADQPEVVKRLQELVAAMDADLGARKVGPGVRPPGRVKEPVPLLLKGER